MEVRNRKIEIEVKEYIAEDGSVFTDENRCRDYEKHLNLLKDIEEADKLRILELDGVLPLGVEGIVDEYSIYRWYKIDNEEDFYTLDRACGNNLSGVDSFPEVICVESSGDDAFDGDVYGYLLSEMLLRTKTFWEKMGYNVKISKRRKVKE